VISRINTAVGNTSGALLRALQLLIRRHFNTSVLLSIVLAHILPAVVRGLLLTLERSITATGLSRVFKLVTVIAVSNHARSIRAEGHAIPCADRVTILSLALAIVRVALYFSRAIRGHVTAIQFFKDTAITIRMLALRITLTDIAILSLPLTKFMVIDNVTLITTIGVIHAINVLAICKSLTLRFQNRSAIQLCCLTPLVRITLIRIALLVITLGRFNSLIIALHFIRVTAVARVILAALKHMAIIATTIAYRASALTTSAETFAVTTTGSAQIANITHGLDDNIKSLINFIEVINTQSSTFIANQR
jgi:hypothetical protein